MPVSDEVIKGLFGLGGGVVGAVIGAGIKGYFDAKARDRRVLLASVTEPTRLVVMAGHIAPRVEIRVDGQPVPTLASSEVALTNTGNRAISDVQVTVNIRGEADLISAEPAGSTAVEGLAVSVEAKHAVIRLPFINPGEQVTVRLFATGRQFTVTPVFRQPEVRFLVRSGGEPEVPHPLMEALFNSIRANPLLHAYFNATEAGYRAYARSLEHRRVRAHIAAEDAAE